MKEYNKEAFKVAALYAILGALWIYFSDSLASLLARTPEDLTSLAMYKGWGYVIVTSLLLFVLLQRRILRIYKSKSEVIQAYDETMEALSFALDLKDRETTWHSKRVTELAVKIAKTMGLEEEQIVHLRRGAMIHDVGKMGIPDSILLKPGALSEEEAEIMKRHPSYANDMLSKIKYLKPALEIPYCHHERWDGSGYPRGLKGEDIPLSARIFMVADVLDALTSDRPYRVAITHDDAIAEIKKGRGRLYDPAVVDVVVELSARGQLSV
jgi:HD-GYP domain-containing protein (c-di-GMP phosphodiesterase class II)